MNPRDLPTMEQDQSDSSRRGLLRLAGAGMAGAAAAVVAGTATARPAAAATTPLYGGISNAVGAETSITATTNPDQVLRILRADGLSSASLAGKSTGVSGSGSTVGVSGDGTAKTSVGVSGTSAGKFGIGVDGIASQGIYGVRGLVRVASTDALDGTAGVYGEHRNLDSNGTGVKGHHLGAGWGMWAISESGIGIVADGGTGTGARGEGSGQYGVHGQRHATATGTPDGTAGVYGEHQNTDGIGTGVIGSHAGSGWGMWAKSVSGLGIHANGGTGTGAEGVSTGARANTYGVVGRLTATAPSTTSAAIRGATSAANNASYGVFGTHAGTGTAVYGQSLGGVGVRGFGGTGRGGVFTGTAAQINLTPGSAASHPTNGTRGDLYVDNGGRLWFCKTGGTTASWIQLG